MSRFLLVLIYLILLIVLLINDDDDDDDDDYYYYYHLNITSSKSLSQDRLRKITRTTGSKNINLY